LNREEALAILVAIDRGRLAVPDQFRVVLLGGELSAYSKDERLVVLRLPSKEVGRTASKMLFDLINGAPAHSVTLPPTEVIGSAG
jgi:DNA-binding LacI/PurR family transcriptional regulator